MFRTLIIALCLSAPLALVVVFASADGPLVDPSPTVLLLRNGRTLEGKIARDGDYYLIARPQGEVRLRADQAEAAFAGYAECYAFKRSRLFADSPDDRLELAGWCITHDLLTEAEAELAEVARLWPRHPRASLVQRRLELARQPVKPPAAPASETADAPSDEQLSEVSKTLPRGTIEAFTATVQPILQYHCASAGCHGPNTTLQFRLERLSPGQPVTGRQTQRNLLAVLGEIDKASPKKSPLLTQAQRPHGSAKDPIFAAHELGRYRQLAAFVEYAASAGRGGAAKSSGDEGKTPAQPASFVKEDRDEVQDEPDSDELADPANTAPPTVPAPSRADPMGDEEPVKNRGRSVKAPEQRLPQEPNADDSLGYVPRDPFDPEIFNRRYATKRPRS